MSNSTVIKAETVMQRRKCSDLELKLVKQKLTDHWKLKKKMNY